MARRDIEFDAEGVTLRGWFYPAEGASGRAPTVVMAHGFSAVKEMYLDSFAEVFAAAGLNALVFDNRCFGASEGEPRQEIDPWAQVRDYRHAITYASTPLAPSALPTADSWEWFSETGNTRAPAWRNEVTLRSVEMFTEYEPGVYLPWISPTPLLMLVAVGDHLVPSELAIAAFDTAHQPKELIIMPGGHFDAYTVGFEASSAPARDWFLRHL